MRTVPDTTNSEVCELMERALDACRVLSSPAYITAQGTSSHYEAHRIIMDAEARLENLPRVEVN